jgi:hypothetical protein
MDEIAVLSLMTAVLDLGTLQNVTERYTTNVLNRRELNLCIELCAMVYLSCSIIEPG